MIKNVLLDLDDTIYDFHKAERAALIKALKSSEINATDEIVELYSTINLSQWKLLEKGEITREQVKVRRFNILFEKLGIDKPVEPTRRAYERFLGIGHYFIDGAEEMLEQLKKDYDLYLVSNGTSSIQKGRIDSGKIEKYFKHIFISEDVGDNKPAVEFFDYCFSKMSVPVKEESVIVGDSLTSDIQGGLNAGIHTCWFNPHNIENSSDIIPEYEISKLSQLYKLLKTI